MNTKKSGAATNATQSMNDGCNPVFIPESEYPSPLIYKLSEFYRHNPKYPTSIVDIEMLSRILYTELAKFVSRPHTKITKICFDRDNSLLDSVE